MEPSRPLTVITQLVAAMNAQDLETALTFCGASPMDGGSFWWITRGGLTSSNNSA